MFTFASLVGSLVVQLVVWLMVGSSSRPLILIGWWVRFGLVGGFRWLLVCLVGYFICALICFGLVFFVVD